MILTKEFLQKHDACEEGIKFCERNKIFGFDLKNINEILGNHHYIDWLKEILRDCIKHDSNGNVLQQLLPSQKSMIFYEYDDRNNVTRKTTKRIDAKFVDQIVESIEYEYDENNNLIFKHFPVTDYWIRYLYRNNKIISEITSNGLWRLFEYDSNKNLTRRHSDQLFETLFAYDDNNNIIKKETISRGNQVEVIDYTYDSNNNLIYTNSSLDSWRKYEYDDHHNKIKIEDRYVTVRFSTQYYPNGQLKSYSAMGTYFGDEIILPYINEAHV
jgi:hypothetical protein